MASVVRGAVVAAAAGGAVGGVGATPHVLAVDDSSVDRAIIAAILRSSRFRGAWLQCGISSLARALALVLVLHLLDFSVL
jgi:two-component response regulator ARR-A family